MYPVHVFCKLVQAMETNIAAYLIANVAAVVEMAAFMLDSVAT